VSRLSPATHCLPCLDALRLTGYRSIDRFPSPTPIPTSLGIHRIHTSTSHQRQGVASILLDAACRYGVYGMEVRKETDGVAFSQPTQSGHALMTGWGKGLVRVFVEDP
jgi:N-acetyltransferase